VLIYGVAIANIVSPRVSVVRAIRRDDGSVSELDYPVAFPTL